MLVQELNLTMEFHAVSEPGTLPWSLRKWSSTHAPYTELGALSVTAEFPFMARTTPRKGIRPGYVYRWISNLRAASIYNLEP